jgi:hypothetical protein
MAVTEEVTRPVAGPQMAPPPVRPAPGRSRAARLRELVIEVVLIASMMVIYQGIRHLADGQMGLAFRHADWVWQVERALRLPSEAMIQHWALSWDATARLANLYYVGVHFPGTVAAMVWLWMRHRSGYLRMRTEMAVLTGAALFVHVLFPLAPPRLVSGFGMVDTMILTGPSAYPDNSTDGVANQFAAMPSLHVGWALLVAIALIRVTTSRWRWLALAHPALTVSVVVITANHYWLDGIVAGLLLVGAIRLVGLRTRYAGGLPGQPLPSFSRVLL